MSVSKADIVSANVAEAMGCAFKKNCDKLVARELDCKPETAKAWRLSRSRPSAKFYRGLIRLLHDQITASVAHEQAILRGLAYELSAVDEDLAYLAHRRRPIADSAQGVLPGIFAEASLGGDD